MLTEQEALAQLNEKLGRNELNENTKKYIEKLKYLNSLLNTQQSAIEDLNKKIQIIEKDIYKTRGAISILLELAAEEEGMLPPK
jgi:CII-binding regulator of phage lambda lysogenization HflD